MATAGLRAAPPAWRHRTAAAPGWGEGFSGPEQALLAALTAQHQPRASTAWLLWALFGPTGMHRVYLRQWHTRMTLAAVAAIALAVALQSWVLLPLGWVVEVWMLPRLIRTRRSEVAAASERVLLAARSDDTLSLLGSLGGS